MTMIEKMTTYLLKMMKETNRPDTHSLFLCLLWASFFYCRIFWRRKVETIFLLIISFVISIRIFDHHALIHVYVLMKKSFYFPEKKCLYLQASAKICPREKFEFGSSAKKCPRKITKIFTCENMFKKMFTRKTFISIRYLFINI